MFPLDSVGIIGVYCVKRFYYYELLRVQFSSGLLFC